MSNKHLYHNSFIVLKAGLNGHFLEKKINKIRIIWNVSGKTIDTDDIVYKNIYFGNKHTKVNEIKKCWIHILYE